MNLYYYYLEIKFRGILLLIVWLTTFLVSYFFKEALLHIITNIHLFDSFAYIFTDVAEVFSVYIHLLFFTTNQILVLYFFYYVLLFVLPSLTYFESTFLVFILLAFYFLFFLSFLFFNTFLFPLSWNFFLSFQQFKVLNSFSLEFEAKLSEYSIFYTTFYFVCFLYFQVFLIPILFLKFIKNSVQFYFSYRKFLYYFGVLFSTMVTPPDVFSQVVFSFSIFICCEILVYCFVLKKCF
uniref:Sec-independent protein translocase component TatC n=1 Tax=Navicula tsukamotoi TaxID=2018706 RepID=UPI0020290C67|nr:Sec-independent protein translocase component TatC [Navicula tsukamotoi]QYB23098.1 Sec-independent protein translocase component TatC [Navicula tsukamotoi]